MLPYGVRVCVARAPYSTRFPLNVLVSRTGAPDAKDAGSSQDRA